MTVRFRSLIVLSSLVSLVSACGGGGGGGGGSQDTGSTAPQASISQSNYQSIATVAVAPMSELTTLNAASGMLVGGVEVRENSLSLNRMSTEIYKRFRARGSQLATGVVYNEDCSVSGSVSINESIADDSRISTGDKLSITATNCKESGIPTMNGKMSLEIASVSGDPLNTNRYSLKLAVTFDNFSLTEGTEKVFLNGDLTMSASQAGTSSVTVGMSGSALTLSTSVSGTATGSIKLSAYEFSGTESGDKVTLSGKYTVSGSSAKIGGNYTFNVETLQPVVLSGSSDFPSSGSVIVRGSPATVTVTALSADSVRIDYSEKGDGVITSTNTMTWQAFDALDS
jgi:hypothetical protein